jgi:hypothetical protein
MLELRQLLLYLEHLVDLLLVFDEDRKRTSASTSTNSISLATASWYSGRGTPPRHCTALIIMYMRGRLSPTMATFSPRWKPISARPQASARTSSATAVQVHDCQMPRSFSRIATLPPRTCAWLNQQARKGVQRLRRSALRHLVSSGAFTASRAAGSPCRLCATLDSSPFSSAIIVQRGIACRCGEALCTTPHRPSPAV